MLVTISLMILRVQNHGQHCDALQAHESTQPVLKGISEILSLIYLIYYLITATRALAVFLSRWNTHRLSGSGRGGLPFQYPF